MRAPLPAYEGHEPFLFVCYSHDDSEAVHAELAALQHEGFRVWYDDGIVAGSEWSEALARRIRDCSVFLYLVTPQSVRSPHCRREVNFALDQDRRIVVAHLEPTELPDGLKLSLNNRQAILRYRHDRADYRARLGRALHEALAVDEPRAESPKTLVSIAAPVGDRGAAPSAPPDDEAPSIGNLPRRRSALIGREAELEQIGALLEESGLVTITGTGGVGKTRIAVEFAQRRQTRYADGAWLVELAPLSEGAQVAAGIARALGLELPPGRDQIDALIVRLRARDCLLVLDNCEHLIDAVAAVAEAVLERTERVKLLASSQELLGVEGERVFRLRSLAEADAAALFVARASAADATFRPRPRDETAIAAICQRLDGIPLAIEMAASRAPALGCEGVLERLDDRFRILTGGRRTALPRQRTLQATLDWSHGLLSPEDAAVFRRLGVFTGGFTLEAASKVCADERLDAVEVIDALASLVAKSLVTADADGEPTRYRLLETTRMYALEQLAAAEETASVQRRRAAYFAEFTAATRRDYYTLTDDAFHARYAPDMANIEGAIDWAFGPDGDPEQGIVITANSWPAWAAFTMAVRYGHWAQTAHERVSASTPANVLTLLRRSLAGCLAGIAPRRAIPFAEQVVDELRAGDDPFALGDTLVSLSQAKRLAGHEEEARRLSEELWEFVARLRPSRLTMASYQTQILDAMLSNPPAAHRLSAEGARLGDSIGAIGWANLLRADSFGDPDGDVEESIAGLRALLRSIRPTHMFRNSVIAVASFHLTYWLATRRGSGDIEEAYEILRGLERFMGRYFPPRFLWGIARIAILDGRPADGARLFGAFLASTAEAGVDFSFSRRNSALMLALLREHLSDSEIEALMADGRRLSPEHVYSLAVRAEP
jgi:predicted ATPase